MNPLSQLDNGQSQKMIPLRVGFHLLFALFFLIEIFLFLTIEKPLFSTTASKTINSSLIIRTFFAEPEGCLPKDFYLTNEEALIQSYLSQASNWFLPKKRTIPFIPRRREVKYPVEEDKQPKVAIIIDDLGFVRQPTEDFWDLRIPLTFSILPWGKYSQLHAAQALDHNQQIMLHLPLEPIDSAINPGPGAILSIYSSEEVLAQLRLNLQTIPGIIGVNNHMGSKGTQNPELMRLIIKELKNQGLFFIDSMTISSSIAYKIAEEEEVLVAIRDVFLDGEGIESIRFQAKRLIDKALVQGAAIGIAHARPGVAKELANCLSLFKQAGIELVYVSELVK